MKLPGYIELLPPKKGQLSEDGRHVIFNIRVRHWHPGLWLELLRRSLPPFKGTPDDR